MPELQGARGLARVGPAAENGRARQWRAAASPVVGGALPAMALLCLVGLATSSMVFKFLAVGCGLAILPVWVTKQVKMETGRALLLGVGLALVNGAVLAAVAADEGRLSPTIAAETTIKFLLGVVCLGAVVWARDRYSDAMITCTLACTMLLSRLAAPESWATNPWKYAFGLPVALLALSFVRRRSTRTQVCVLLTLGLVGVAFDHRSFLGICWAGALLLLASAALRRGVSQRKVMSAAVLLSLIGALAYRLLEVLILSGRLGAELARRSADQIDAGTGLILGGRPELLATGYLFWRGPAGRGPGVLPAPVDVATVQDGIARAGGDPNLAFALNYMLGDGFHLHSLLGDLWVNFGIAGMALVGMCVAIVVRGLVRAWSAPDERSALIFFLLIQAAWSLPFGTIDTGWVPTALCVGLVLRRRPVHGRSHNMRVNRPEVERTADPHMAVPRSSG